MQSSFEFWKGMLHIFRINLHISHSFKSYYSIILKKNLQKNK